MENNALTKNRQVEKVMKNYFDDAFFLERIASIKEHLGEKLIILTHHYQRKEIVDLGDYRGDSFGLSQLAAANTSARHIVFCGVHFMAESAEILSQPHQTVQLPDLHAGCPMSDMADYHRVKQAWDQVVSISGEQAVMPIVYMNSDARLKAFCGRRGGMVCTSSNTPAAFWWGFDRREKVFFFPDRHLGYNAGRQLNIPPEEIIVWDPEKPLGGHTETAVRKAKLILWNGYCHIHTRFRPGHILKMRQEYPQAKIVVHPECTPDVVALADATGSTGFIVKYVENAPPDTTIIIGTEINLINRLALEHPDKIILDLKYSLCPNMFKIDPKNLLWTLENIGKANMIAVPEPIKADARLALDRMLALADHEHVSN